MSSFLLGNEKLDKIMKSINNMKNIKNEIITFVNSISEDKKNQENKCIDIEG